MDNYEILLEGSILQTRTVGINSFGLWYQQVKYKGKQEKNKHCDFGARWFNQRMS